MTAASATDCVDRSVLRRLRKEGDTSRDGRGRLHSMPSILQYGFRPFFFLASVHAGLAIPSWLWLYVSGRSLPGAFPGLEWHAHEMLFGYLGAVVAGFILTAVPNWTGRLPLSGWPLAGLVAAWALGRLACAFVSDPLAALALDLVFPSLLAFSIWREVISGPNWRNAPVAAMLTLFGVANALHHGENLGIVPHDFGLRIALGVAVMLIALIGGRIVPSFTRNWLAKQDDARLPASFGPLDKAALAATAVAVVSWIAIPGTPLAGGMLLVAGTLLALRLARWRGWRILREPIVLVLHLGYGWLSISLMLLGLSDLTNLVPTTAALHALTAGAIGTMTLAVMTRASLGHTGREIRADVWIQAIYVAVTAGAVLRVAAPLAPDLYLPLLAAGGTLWALAFVLFAVRFTPVLWGPRR